VFEGEKGQAIVLVLLVTAVVFAVGTAALGLGSTAHRIAVMEVAQKKAYYIAEAGVEKALARAVADPDWVTSLPYRSDFADGQDEVLLNSAAYEAAQGGTPVGTIREVRVIKTYVSPDGSEVRLKLKSAGETPPATRTLTVEADLMYPLPETLFKGLWVTRLQGFPQGAGVSLDIDTYVAEGDVTIPEDSSLKGSIYSKGKVVLDGQKNHEVQITGSIYALGGVELRHVKGLGDGSLNVYADDANKVVCGDGVTVNYRVVVLSSQELLSKMPASAPDLLSAQRLAWYRANADFTVLPSDLNFGSGIYYIQGDVRLAGTYAGQALIVVDGEVTVGDGSTEYLRKRADQDCLIILATGEVRTHNGHIEPIEAFVYSGAEVRLQNSAIFRGGIVSPALDSQGNTVSVQRDANMLAVYRQSLSWTTAVIKIRKWAD